MSLVCLLSRHSCLSSPTATPVASPVTQFPFSLPLRYRRGVSCTNGAGTNGGLELMVGWLQFLIRVPPDLAVELRERIKTNNFKRLKMTVGGAAPLCLAVSLRLFISVPSTVYHQRCSVCVFVCPDHQLCVSRGLCSSVCVCVVLALVTRLLLASPLNTARHILCVCSSVSVVLWLCFCVYGSVAVCGCVCMWVCALRFVVYTST